MHNRFDWTHYVVLGDVLESLYTHSHAQHVVQSSFARIDRKLRNMGNAHCARRPMITSVNIFL